MEKTSLMSIKRESVKAIFKAVAEGDNISRSEISAKTGLSLMTVGKVIDALLELGVVCQVKEKKSAAGRKAGLINLQNDTFMLIIDLTSTDFSMSIVDIKLGVIDKMIYSYNTNFYFEENLFIFLKNVKIYLGRRFDMEKLIGTGITLPGRYDAENDKVISSRIAELNNIKIKEIIEGALDVKISFFEEDIKSAALSNINSVSGDEGGTLSYVYIGNETLNAVTITDGQILYGESGGAGNIKKMLIDGTNNYESALSGIDTLDAFLHVTSVVLFNLALVVDPSMIILECEKFKLNSDSIASLKALMEKYNTGSTHPLPEIILSEGNIKHSHRGIAMKLREKWLEKIIK